MNLKASSNIMRPYNDPNFRNIKHYLQPGFPNEYPYSQYINYEGDLVHTPWRESEGPQDYCFSQYADIESQPEESNYAVTRIDPLVLPTQYSSEDSDSEDEEDSHSQPGRGLHRRAATRAFEASQALPLPDWSVE